MFRRELGANTESRVNGKSRSRPPASLVVVEKQQQEGNVAETFNTALDQSQRRSAIQSGASPVRTKSNGMMSRKKMRTRGHRPSARDSLTQRRMKRERETRVLPRRGGWKREMALGEHD